MNYAEAAYFDGNHCAHVATRDDNRRLKRIDNAGREAYNAAMARRALR